MIDSSDDILIDIDETLHQLIENAQALKVAKLTGTLIHEAAALEKTQESLLARLMHRQSLLELDRRQKTLNSIRKEMIDHKVAQYAKSLKNRPQNPASLRKARSKSRG